jgi:hypothetical protein
MGLIPVAVDTKAASTLETLPPGGRYGSAGIQRRLMRGIQKSPGVGKKCAAVL